MEYTNMNFFDLAVNRIVPRPKQVEKGGGENADFRSGSDFPH